MIIPGWAQIHCRHRLRGQLLMLAWLACLIPGLVFAGTGGGSFLVGLAIAIHCISALDIVLVDSTSMLDRMGRGALALVIINGLIYFPAARLITSVAAPQTFLQDTDHLNAGAVLLVNGLAYRVAEPQAGDIVLYDLPELTETVYANHRQYRVEGRRLDRIIASGGQHVVFKDGQLTVDGIGSELRPLRSIGLPPTVDIHVPPQSFLIFPSLDGYLPPELVPPVSIIGRSRIHGKAWWQSQPLSNFGPVN